MPNPTTNYAWAMPIEGGSTGTWDTILNAAIEAIDADLKIVDTAATTGKTLGEAAFYGDFMIAAGFGHEAAESGTPQELQWYHVGIGERGFNAGTANAQRLYFRVAPLSVGSTLGAIRSYGYQNGGTVTVALVRIDATGAETVVHAGHTLPASPAALTETTGIAHTVLADNDYYIRVVITEPASLVLVTLNWVGYTTAAA